MIKMVQLEIFFNKFSKVIWILVLIMIKSTLSENHYKASLKDDDEICFAKNKKLGNEEMVKADFSKYGYINEDGTCDVKESIKQQTSNFYPFVVIEPIVEPDEYGNVHNSWCDGIMISDVWGIAPPNCFVENKIDYFLSLSERTSVKSFRNNRKLPSPKTCTFAVKLQFIMHPDIKYNWKTNTYCNYIALFKLRNFRFYFDSLIQLPKDHFFRDLYYKMHEVYPVRSKPGDKKLHQYQSTVDEDQKCKIIGAQFQPDHISFTFGTIKLTPIREYCTLFPSCSALDCLREFSNNITYVNLNIPMTATENGCRIDVGYHYGTSLVCFDDDSLEWTLYGIATNEVVLSCSGANLCKKRGSRLNKPYAYMAFTRIDAHVQWMIKTILMHGGWSGL